MENNKGAKLPVLVTAQQAATMVGVSYSTVRRWANGSMIAPVARTVVCKKGADLFRIDDVRRVADETDNCFGAPRGGTRLWLRLAIFRHIESCGLRDDRGRPYCDDTVDDIARTVGRSYGSVAHTLSVMVSEGLVERFHVKVPVQTTGQHMRRRTVVTKAGAEFVSRFEGVDVPEFPVRVCRASQAPEDRRAGDTASTGLHDVQGG